MRASATAVWTFVLCFSGLSGGLSGVSGLAIVAVPAVGLASALSACSGPHSGKSEKLKKPRKKTRPEGEETTENTEAALDESACKTNFFAEPVTRRDAKDGRRLANQAEGIIVDADRAEDDEKKRGLIVEALEKLTSSLKKDPYGPSATYKMAVAYAIARRKSCALAVLERLSALQAHEKVGEEAKRTVQRAVREPAFEAFRKEANTALGE